MMNDDNTLPGDARPDRTDEAARGQSARRRLLRGVFAAPAVLTLHSGSAFAMASVSCLKKANDAVNPPTPAASVNTDGYIRVRLWKRVQSGEADQFWVSGNDLSPYAGATSHPPFLTNTQWQQFNVNQNALVTGAGQPSSSQPIGVWTQDGHYVVLRIDKDGAVVGVGTSGGGVAVGQSCWNSFAMM